MTSLDFDVADVGKNLIQLGIAYVLAFPIGLNREKISSSAGIRTFPLVSMTSCAYMLVGISTFSEQEAIARILYGIITGMGFIGGGAILKQGGAIAGTATATALWTTGAIGISVALSRYEIAVVLSVMTLLVFMLKKKEKPESQLDLKPDLKTGP